MCQECPIDGNENRYRCDVGFTTEDEAFIPSLKVVITTPRVVAVATFFALNCSSGYISEKKWNHTGVSASIRGDQGLPS